MKMTLNEPAIARAARQARETGVRLEMADVKHPGLRLRITPPSRLDDTVRLAWYLTCRDRMGRMRRFPLGNYGSEAPNLGVADARDAARGLLVRVRNEGADPVRDRQRDRAIGRDAASGVGTLKAALEVYGRGPGSKLKSWPESRKRVALVFSKLMDRPVAAMSALDLQAEAEAYKSGQSASFAVRTIRPALKWLAKLGHVPPGLSSISQPAKPGERDRVLTREELAVILPTLKASGAAHALMLRFALMTLCRRNEAGQARWRDFSAADATWTIPAANSKNAKSHVVPLPAQAQALLLKMKPKDVQSDALIFASKAGTALGGWDRWLKTLHMKTKTAPWSAHDLRRTGATMLGDLGYTPDITEAALNHTVIRSSLSSRYNRSRYRPQVAAALQALATELDEIAGKAASAR